MRGCLSSAGLEKNLPRYLLFLSDLDKISLETQQAVSVRHYTGRLAFSDLDDKEDPRAYEAYAKKGLGWEDPARAKKSLRAVAFSARGGDDATEGALLVPDEPGPPTKRKALP